MVRIYFLVAVLFLANSQVLAEQGQKGGIPREYLQEIIKNSDVFRSYLQVMQSHAPNSVDLIKLLGIDLYKEFFRGIPENLTVKFAGCDSGGTFFVALVIPKEKELFTAADLMVYGKKTILGAMEAIPSIAIGPIMPNRREQKPRVVLDGKYFGKSDPQVVSTVQIKNE